MATSVDDVTEAMKDVVDPELGINVVDLGLIYDVMVDIRPSSPTYGQWQGIILSADNPQQLWIPAGFAHGFQALDSTNLVFYKTSSYYNPSDEGVFQPFDPKLNISWPLQDAILSEKESQAPNADW